MIRINLLPVRVAQKRAKSQRQLLVAGLVLGLTILACGGLYLSLVARVAREKAEIAEIQTELNSLRKAIGEVAQFKKLQAELQSKLDVLEDLKRKKTGPVHLLDELSRVLPDKLWLTSFTEKGGQMTIKGVGLNENIVATFIRDLESSPYYQKVDLTVTRQVVQEGIKLHEFEITSGVAIPQPAVTATGEAGR
jgi:type IV pilus assembly protein PilN